MLGVRDAHHVRGATADLYRTLAQGCFTLLGLWWVVVQNKRELWFGDPARRRQAWHVSLLFLLPGTASLLALLAPEDAIYWRAPFAVAGVLGALETATTIARERRLSRQLVLAPTGMLFAVLALLAIAPGVAGDVGIDARPIVLEGAVAALAVFLAVQLAWMLFTEPDEGLRA